MRHQDRKAEADEAWEKAVSLQLDFAEAQYNLATSKLSDMNFAEGWSGFGWRGQADPLSFHPQTEAHPFSQPRWQGEPLEGKSIFLWGEQGLGDQILFSSLVPEIAAKAGNAFLECEPRLARLFARSFPDVAVVPRVRPVGEALSHADIQFQCPLGDLGKFFRPTIESFKKHGGYLKPDDARVVDLKAKYKALGDGAPVVGLAWRSPRKRFGALKSTNLAEDWGDVFAIPGLTFVSLQYGETQKAIAAAEQRHSVKIYADAEIDATEDIDALAAQIAAMDLVVSISNTTVHLAGGLGIPVWTIVPSGAGRLWYWFNGLDYSPWYPSMRLFQQETPGSWSAVMAQVAAALKTRFGRGGR